MPPAIALPSSTPGAAPNPENKPTAAAAIPHAGRTGVQPKHECPDTRPANVLYSCIDRASCDKKQAAGLRDIYAYDIDHATRDVGGDPTHALFAAQSRSIVDNLVALFEHSRAWN